MIVSATTSATAAIVRFFQLPARRCEQGADHVAGKGMGGEEFAILLSGRRLSA